MLTERNMMMKMNTNVTTEAFSYTKKPRRNCYSPTSTKTITPFPSSSHFPRSCTPGNHFPLSSSSLLWCVILLLLYCPTYMVNGLPLMMTKRSNHGLGQDVILHSSLTLRGSFVYPEKLWHWHLQNKNNMLKKEQEVDSDSDDDDTSNMQEVTGSDERDNKVLGTRTHPRQKKGLSYLTKYYTEAFLNNTPSSGGVANRSGSGGSGNTNAKLPHDSYTNSFFGVSTTGSSGASGELRFPSSVRRKLSFYPAMTSHSVYISPWSRVSSSGGASGGRSPTMRLRWGK